MEPTWLNVLVLVLGTISILACVFIPTRIAHNNKHINTVSITALNMCVALDLIVLGVTMFSKNTDVQTTLVKLTFLNFFIFGWVTALIWSLKK